MSWLNTASTDEGNANADLDCISLIKKIWTANHQTKPHQNHVPMNKNAIY